MIDPPDNYRKATSLSLHARLGPALLIHAHIIICCLSLVYVAEFYAYLEMVLFDQSRIFVAALSVMPVAALSILFAFSRFSFGYVLGFYFYTMILGYLWILPFSGLNYDHRLAAASAFASAIAFLVPALFIASPIRQRYTLSPQALHRLPSFILVLATLVIAAGAVYNFKLVSLSEIYDFRNELQFPAWLGYLMGTTSSALLPFAFACFVSRGDRWRAALSLVLLIMFYPITLTKLMLFAPAWLLILALLSELFESRTSVVLSLFVPVTVGVILATLSKLEALPFDLVRFYFGSVNFRMMAVPSSALDYYNDFFSRNDITHFCQISFLKLIIECPYSDPLSIVMEKTYQLGNFNASLFATEGIASVGQILAPISAFVCGLVIAFGNRLAAGLPPKFILLSGGVLPQVFLNVPLSTTLLTNGASILVLLWYVTPRDIQPNRL